MTITEDIFTYASTIDPALTALGARLYYDSAASNRPLLVVGHGFTGISTSFALTTRQRMPKATFFYLRSAAGTFTAGETVTGGSSGATGMLFAANTTRMALSAAVGTFVEGETVTGGTSGATAIIDTVISSDVVCLFYDMRGRNGGSGSQDAAGREIYDIIDAVRWVLANRASRVDATQIHFVGYSGGGGNGLSLACRAPDLFNSIVCYFPISDYGYERNYSWWWERREVSDGTTLATWVGGTPLTHRKHYQARRTREAIANYSQGQMCVLHDRGDGTVAVSHSERIRDRVEALGYDHISVTLTTTGDSPRALHANPDIGAQPQLTLFEHEYMQQITNKVLPALTVPSSGTLLIAGWVTTKRFEFWADDGLDNVATLQYDTTTRTFTIVSMTGSFPWTLRLYSQTPSAGVTATIDGEGYTVTASVGGVATFTGTHTPLAIGIGQVFIADGTSGDEI